MHSQLKENYPCINLNNKYQTGIYRPSSSIECLWSHHYLWKGGKNFGKRDGVIYFTPYHICPNLFHLLSNMARFISTPLSNMPRFISPPIYFTSLPNRTYIISFPPPPINHVHPPTLQFTCELDLLIHVMFLIALIWIYKLPLAYLL